MPSPDSIYHLSVKDRMDGLEARKVQLEERRIYADVHADKQHREAICNPHFRITSHSLRLKIIDGILSYSETKEDGWGIRARPGVAADRRF
jgi:hypothetical protein